MPVINSNAKKDISEKKVIVNCKNINNDALTCSRFYF